jgi:hypothetical protein
MNPVTVAVAAWLGFLGQANPDLELENVVRQATEACETALEAMPQAKGKGRYEYTVKDSVDGETTFEREGAYSFAFSGEKNWGRFVKSLERDYDATVYISDPENLMVAYFDNEIRPGGGHGIIRKRTHPGSLPQKLFVTPQAATWAWAFFRVWKPGDDENRLRTLEKVEDQYVIQSEENGNVYRFHINPNKGFHLVRYESREPDGYTTRIVTKDWRTTADGLWYVRAYHRQDFPIRARTSYTSSEITIDSIEPKISIPPDVFTVGALGLPENAWVKDTRVKPNQRIRFLRLKADMAAFGRVLPVVPAGQQD